MNYVKHRINTFRKQTKLSTKALTFGDLSLAANKLGYIVKPYSTSKAIMIAFSVYEEGMKAASVSFKDNASNAIIFINDKLSADKQLFALAHEIGHIYLGHNSAVPKAQQEEEANRFANYLLSNNTNNLSSRIPFALFLFFALTLSLIMIISPFKSQERSAEPSMAVSADTNQCLDESATYYWTESGYVFHYYRNCQALMHCDNILSGDYWKAVEEKERLCKFCEDKLK